MDKQTLTIKRISEFYNTAHLIRPVQPDVVQDYAAAMKDGSIFPPLKLGIYQGQDKKDKIIIDGVHTFKAATVAGIKKLSVVITTYPSLADALAAQLKANANQGLRLTPEDRDARIRMLVQIYKWRIRRVAAKVGLHYSSVSRIASPTKKQNLSGTGKSGPKGPRKMAPVVQHALPPKTFFRTVQNIHLTISKVKSQTAIVAAMRDPKTVKNVSKAIGLFRQVVDEFQQLIKFAQAVEKGEEGTEAA